MIGITFILNVFIVCDLHKFSELKHQIPEVMHSSMLEFTPAEFGLVATSLDDLSNFTGEHVVFPTSPSSTLITARIRMMA